MLHKLRSRGVTKENRACIFFRFGSWAQFATTAEVENCVIASCSETQGRTSSQSFNDWGELQLSHNAAQRTNDFRAYAEQQVKDGTGKVELHLTENIASQIPRL